jgi:DinB family protein
MCTSCDVLLSGLAGRRVTHRTTRPQLDFATRMPLSEIPRRRSLKPERFTSNFGDACKSCASLSYSRVAWLCLYRLRYYWDTMAAPTTPYSSSLGDRDPLASIRDCIEQVQALTSDWPPNRYERSYAPGKWTARQVLTHLAQIEFALGTRARMAVVTPGYVAQNFDQDAWIALEAGLPGRGSADAFVAIARMNLAFFEGLSPAARATALTHPEHGELTVDWIVHMMAGHQIHHLGQLQRVG